MKASWTTIRRLFFASFFAVLVYQVSKGLIRLLGTEVLTIRTSEDIRNIQLPGVTLCAVMGPSKELNESSMEQLYGLPANISESFPLVTLDNFYK